MISIAQFILYLVVGMFLLFVMGAYLSASAGTNTLGLIMVFSPMVIAWICPGLVLFIPRITSAFVMLLMLPFLYVSISDLIDPPPASEPWIFFVPILLVFTISIIAMAKSRESIWSRAKTIWMKCLVVFLSIAPAAWGFVTVIRFISNVTFVR